MYWRPNGRKPRDGRYPPRRDRPAGYCLGHNVFAGDGNEWTVLCRTPRVQREAAALFIETARRVSVMIRFMRRAPNRRRLPGEGAFDVPAFVAAVHRAGYRGHWGVEIISEEHRQLPVREALTRARTATLQTLDAAEALVATAG